MSVKGILGLHDNREKRARHKREVLGCVRGISFILQSQLNSLWRGKRNKGRQTWEKEVMQDQIIEICNLKLLVWDTKGEGGGTACNIGQTHPGILQGYIVFIR